MANIVAPLSTFPGYFLGAAVNTPLANVINALNGIANGTVAIPSPTITSLTVTGATTLSTLTTTGTTSTPTILPAVAGAGTAIQSPISSGNTFAAPVTLTAAQSGTIILSDAAAGTKYILPAATAANEGVTFEFFVTTTVTSNSFDVEGATSADLFVAGSSFLQILLATPVTTRYSPNGSSNYKLTMNGTTTGGIIGDRVKFVCLGLNKWLVNGIGTQTSSTATPFAG